MKLSYGAGILWSTLFHTVNIDRQFEPMESFFKNIFYFVCQCVCVCVCVWRERIVV